MGGGLESCSLWMKLVVIFTGLALVLDLFSAASPGWSGINSYDTSYTGRAINVHSARATNAFGVIGFLSVLIAFVLTLCMLLLDELKSAAKVILIIVCVVSFIAGLAIIISIGTFEDNYTHAPASSTIGVMGAICAALAGVFAILELVNVPSKISAST